MNLPKELLIGVDTVMKNPYSVRMLQRLVSLQFKAQGADDYLAAEVFEQEILMVRYHLGFDKIKI